MKLSNATLFGMAAALVLMPVGAMADDKDRRGDRMNKRMEKLDTNKDGKLSIDEMLTRTSARFDAADANKDGEISLEEMTDSIERRRAERRAKRILNRMDLNGDGKVTKSEIENRARKRFALADRNDDGFIEKSEMRKSRFGKGRKGDRRKKRRNRDSEL